MNVTLHYKDGTVIPYCDGTVASLTQPGSQIADGRRIDEGLITDHGDFDFLYGMWLEPCVELMTTLPGVRAGAVRNLFFPPEDGHPAPDEEYLRQFIVCFGNRICGYSPFPAKAAIWPSCDFFDIYDAVDQALDGAEAYLKLRVKAVCACLNAYPDQAFSLGVNWSAPFLPKPRGAREADIAGGEEYELVLREPATLIPVTLKNPAPEQRAVTVVYGGKKYKVSLPANGFMRAVFNEKGNLVNLKGAISLNYSITAAGNANAVIQMADGQRLCCLPLSTKRPWDYTGVAGFMDAAADGQGAANVLMPGGVFNTFTNRINGNAGRPIRLYGGGRDWAFLYADGRVEANVRFQNGEKMTKAHSIVENGFAGLMFRDAQGAWMSKGGRLHQVSDDEFAGCMLARFDCGASCERASAAPFATVDVNGNGTLYIH